MNSELYRTIELFKNIVSDVLTPRPRMLVSDWADEYRVLVQGSSAEPGRWNTARAEYQREIMNVVNDPAVENVAIKSSAQIGKTEIVLNLIGYYMEYEPSPILVVNPTIEMAQAFSKDRLAPMIAATKILRDKVRSPRSKDSDNTILHKSFPGGHVTLAGANSPASLASRPIRIVLLDEVDRYPLSAGSEGSPIKLAEKRANTFWNRKLIKVSTPTIASTSEIEKEFRKGSMEEWSVQCPNCKNYQSYNFRRINFSDMKMSCEYCKEAYTQQEWREQPHEWIAEHPERESFRSFHLNALASPWVKWESIVEEFQDANNEYKKYGSTEKLKTFVNTVLGEVWEEKGEGADELELYDRREEYEAELPDGVIILTAGIDTQDDRLEVEVVGWGLNYESWGIRKFVIHKDPALDSTWEELGEYIKMTTFRFQSGNELNIAAACVDTGGHHTNQVYKFIRRCEKQHIPVYGIKGYANTPGIPLVYKRSKVEIKNANGMTIDETHIMILGVDSGKEDIVAWLNVENPGPRYCHFPKDDKRGYDEIYFKGLTSEEKITKMVKGRMKIQWVKKAGVRNEPFDIRIYAYAAVEMISPNWTLLAQKVGNGINYMKKTAVTAPKRKRGAAKRGVELY